MAAVTLRTGPAVLIVLVAVRWRVNNTWVVPGGAITGWLLTLLP